MTITVVVTPRPDQFEPAEVDLSNVSLSLVTIFGGTSASFPALKRSGVTLQVKLADDSALTNLDVASLTVTGVAKTTPFTVATLPSASTNGAGSRSFVTDSNATLAAGLGNTVAGGGSNKVPVYSDGTNWKIGG